MYPQWCMAINSSICSSLHFRPVTTGAFSRNVGKLFSKLKLVTDNLLFSYAEANWKATENLCRLSCFCLDVCTILRCGVVVHLPGKCVVESLVPARISPTFSVTCHTSEFTFLRNRISCYVCTKATFQCVAMVTWACLERGYMLREPLQRERSTHPFFSS